MNPHSPKLQIEYQPICQCDGIPALRAMALYQQQEEETRESPESKKGEWSTTAYGTKMQKGFIKGGGWWYLHIQKIPNICKINNVSK